MFNWRQQPIEAPRRMEEWLDELTEEWMCTYHPKALGSNPEHTIFALLKLEWEKDENKQKEAWIGPYLKSVKFEWSEDDEYSKI